MKKFITTIIKHTAIFGGGKVGGKIVGFLLLPLYTKYLNPIDYGVLELLSVTLNISAILVVQGLPSAFLRGYRMEYKDDENSKRNILSTSYFYMLLSSIIIYGLFFLSSRQINTLLFTDKNFEDLIKLICITGFVSANTFIPAALMRARLESAKYSIINVCKITINLSVNIIFVVFLELGISGIIFGNLITSTIELLVMAWIVRKHIVFQFSRTKLIEMLSFGWPLVPGSLSMLILTSSDRYFLQFFGFSEELGLYSLGYKLSSIMNVVILTPFFMVWPTMYLPLGNEKNGKETISKFASYFLLLIFFIGCSVIVFSNPIVRIMAEQKFIESYKVCYFIVSSLVLWGVAGIFNVGIHIKKKTKYVPIITASSAFINILFNLILIPKYGMIGAGIATFIGYLVYCSLSFVYSQKNYYIKYEWRKLRILIFAYLSVVTISYFSIVENILLNIAIAIGLLIAFIFSIFASNFFSKNEIKKLKSIFIEFFKNNKINAFVK